MTSAAPTHFGVQWGDLTLSEGGASTDSQLEFSRQSSHLWSPSSQPAAATALCH